MREFKSGDNVVFVNFANELEKGVIKNAYPSLQQAIVITEDDNLRKVPFYRVAFDDVPAETETYEESEPVEKSDAITITPDEFRTKGIETIIKFNEGKIAHGLYCTMFLAELHKALFGSDSEDD